MPTLAPSPDLPPKPKLASRRVRKRRPGQITGHAVENSGVKQPWSNARPDRRPMPAEKLSLGAQKANFLGRRTGLRGAAVVDDSCRRTNKTLHAVFFGTKTQI